MMRRKLFANELTSIPELMRRNEKGTVQGRFEVCLKCGHGDRPVAPTGLCARCGGRQPGWRGWHPRDGQPPFYAVPS